MTFPSRVPCFVLIALLGLCIGIAGPSDTHAQSGVRSVGGVGTGGGTSALENGPSTMYSNPADLTVGTVDRNLEIQLFRVAGYVGGNLVQFNHYETLFLNEGDPLTNDQARSSLNDWFGSSKRRISTYASVTPLAITYRPDDGKWGVGVGIRSRTIQTGGMDKGLLDLALRGTALGSDERKIPINGDSRAYSTVDVKGTFSYRLSSLPLSVGVSPSLIFGLGYAGGDFSSTATVSESSLVHNFDYTARAAGAPSRGVLDEFSAFNDDLVDDEELESNSGLAGIGGGIDLGATYEVRPDLHASLSITDLGLIKWTKDAQTVTPKSSEFRFDGVEPNALDGDLGDEVEAEVDSLLEKAYEDVNRDRSSFTTGLPTTLHLSSTWDQGIVILNGGVSVGLNQDAGATPDPVAVHVGSKLDAGPIPLRAGVRFFGSQAMTFTGGVGFDLGFYQLELGGSVTPSTSTLGSGARYAVSLSLGTIRI
ncbi:MAG: hypothetical protein BRD55_02385 [Bacteroidetes bacterium SW_9_63_38]|nr:MAG: hypothetical protein BRD55_02385 [Bacteroidetes bacterium SW_9_63_38]